MEGEHVEMQELVPNSGNNKEGVWRGSPRVNKHQLKRELTLVHMVGLVVGGIIGSGIFISPRVVVKNSQSYGMALVIWVVAGMLAMCGGLCYSELGTLIKKAGEVAYIKQAYSFNSKKPQHLMIGELLSFLFAWSNSLLVRPASTAIILQTFGEYVTKAAEPYCDLSPKSIKMLALSALGVMMLLNCYSAKLSSMLTTSFSFVKLIAAALIISVGLWKFIDGTSSKTQPHGLFEGTSSSPANLVLAFYAALWAFDGWSNVNYATEEMTNVEKTLPRALMIGIPLVIVVYLLINLSFFAVLSIHEIVISDSEAIAIPFGYRTMGDAGLVIIPVIVACSTFGAANAGVFVVGRLNYTSARDGIFPKFLAGIHAQYRTPIPAVLFHTALSSIYICSGGIIDLLNGCSAAIWVFYSLTLFGLIIMRYTYSQTPRPFKVWTVLPVIMVVVGVILVVVPLSNPEDSLYQLIALGIILLGVPVYLVAIQGYCKPRVLTKINDQLAELIDDILNTTPPHSPTGR